MIHVKVGDGGCKYSFLDAGPRESGAGQLGEVGAANPDYSTDSPIVYRYVETRSPAQVPASWSMTNVDVFSRPVRNFTREAN